MPAGARPWDALQDDDVQVPSAPQSDWLPEDWEPHGAICELPANDALPAQRPWASARGGYRWCENCGYFASTEHLTFEVDRDAWEHDVCETTTDGIQDHNERRRRGHV